MQIPSTYATYLIDADGKETKIEESVWKIACIEAADKAIVGRVDCRAVVVTFNFTMLRDDVVYEVASAPIAPAFQVREYPNGQPSTIMDRGILVSCHTTWKEAAARAEALDAEGRAVYVCRASEAQPKAISL